MQRLLSVLPILASFSIALVNVGCDENAPLASCDGVTCSGNGTCAVAGNEAVCVCDAGFGAVGQECLSCSDIPAIGEHDIDIPSVRLYGAFTVAGAPPPLAAFDSGEIWLESAEQGRVYLGSTHEQSYVRHLLPGTYDVYYVFAAGGDQVPVNTHARIGTLDVYKNGRADVDVPVTEISGAITLDGAAPPAGENEDGVIVLVNTSTGDHALAGNTHDGSYTVRVVPGVYDVRYRLESGGSIVPANSDADIGDVNIAANGGVFDFDLPTVDVAGAMTLNGVAFPVSQVEDGNLYLAGADGRDLVLLGNTHLGSFDAPVLIGTYEIYYRLESGGAVVPANRWGHVGSANVTARTTSLDIDVQSFALAGRFTVDGELPPASQYDDGNVWLRGGGDELLLGNTHSVDFAVTAIAGSFDVVYESETPGVILPVNSGARILEKVVAANDSAFFIDIEAGNFTGNILFNGAPAAQSEYDDGLIVVENVSTGDRAVLANTHDLQLDARLVRGSYDVYFEVETFGETSAANAHAYLGELNVDAASVDQPVNVTIASLAGALRLNGKTPPVSEYDDGVVSVRDLARKDHAVLGDTHDTSFETRLVPQTYDVFYSLETPGGTMPENVDGRISCFAVDALF